MKTATRKPRLAGFITDHEHMRLLRKKRPEVYASLKQASPRTCVAWNTLDRRGKLKLSQAELAEKSGLSRRSVQYLEDVTAHFSPSLDVLEKVAKALNFHVTDLFKQVDLTKPTPREDKEMRHRHAEMKKGKSVVMHKQALKEIRGKVKPENLHGETKTGRVVGKEVW
jgi:transcriptional regulator with XRE-family HTH domain